MAAALTLLALCTLFAACRDAQEGAATDRDALTRRQKDSIVATLPIPGAAGIGNALRVSDSMAARSARHDSLLATP